MSLFAASNAIHWTPSDAILPMQCVRRGSTGEGRELGDHAAVIRGSTSR